MAAMEPSQLVSLLRIDTGPRALGLAEGDAMRYLRAAFAE